MPLVCVETWRFTLAIRDLGPFPHESLSKLGRTSCAVAFKIVLRRRHGQWSLRRFGLANQPGTLMSATSGNPPRLLDQVREMIRIRHYSVRTEQAYVQWIRSFILFHRLGQAPAI